MPTSNCPCCGEVIEARFAVELKSESDRQQRRVKAAEDVAEALWNATSELQSLLYGREREKDWNLERLRNALTRNLEELREAQRAFRDANRRA
jgi:hypothetical protein